MNAAIAMPTLADAVWPEKGLRRDLLAVGAASLFIAACARVAIPLPFTPVPLSGGTLGVLYAGALLGARRGAAAVLLYLLEGAVGLPVFAGGAAGFVHFAGPTGGYLVGFPVGAFVTGLLAERGWDRTPARAFAMTLLGSLPILGLGCLGLARFMPASAVLPAGLYPFVPGDLIKAAFTAGLLPFGWSLLGGRASK
ncbi:MAG: biotin transporter BioY [Elusimicrobiota bacterium]|nr:biotin transporter BioY [Elusimicrobiota bacterium]